MRRERTGFRRRRLALTPLIDVIFLLLLFFMLSSTFSRFGEVELAVAAAGAPAVADTAPVFLRLSGDGLSVNGRIVGEDEIDGTIDRFRGDGPVRLLLSVTEGADAQALTDAVVALGAVPDSSFAVVR